MTRPPQTLNPPPLHPSRWQAIGHVHHGGRDYDKDFKNLVAKLTGHYDWSVAAA